MTHASPSQSPPVRGAETIRPDVVSPVTLRASSNILHTFVSQDLPSGDLLGALQEPERCSRFDWLRQDVSGPETERAVRGVTRLEIIPSLNSDLDADHLGAISSGDALEAAYTSPTTRPRSSDGRKELQPRAEEEIAHGIGPLT